MPYAELYAVVHQSCEFGFAFSSRNGDTRTTGSEICYQKVLAEDQMRAKTRRENLPEDQSRSVVRLPLVFIGVVE